MHGIRMFSSNLSAGCRMGAPRGVRRGLRHVKCCVIAGFAALTFIHLCGWTPYAQQKGDSARKDISAQVRLGARLFNDDRFSSPKGELPASCSHCHMLDEDPQGARAYVDFFSRSWVSWRSKDPRREG